MFSSSTEPIVADDWLRRIGRELTTAGCTDAEKVRFAAHQLDGPAASWWENYTTTFPIAIVSASIPHCSCLVWSYEDEEA